MEIFQLKMQHSSLQFSDKPKQQRRDLRDLFSLGKRFEVKTGTEAGKSDTNKNREYLKHFAELYNHRIHFAADNWIAVHRDIIRPNTWDTGHVFAVDNEETKGRGHDTVMATVHFEHVEDGFGEVNIGACHYPTQGRKPGDPNWDENRTAAEKFGAWLEDVAQGSALGFINGDFNMADPISDWAFGENFTSMADELHDYEGTGHGPIDGFTSYDRDGRVSAAAFRVLDDREFFQHSDHFVCRGVWNVRSLKV